MGRKSDNELSPRHFCCNAWGGEASEPAVPACFKADLVRTSLSEELEEPNLSSVKR
jgi:hypothetical protein